MVKDSSALLSTRPQSYNDDSDGMAMAPSSAVDVDMEDLDLAARAPRAGFVTAPAVELERVELLQQANPTQQALIGFGCVLSGGILAALASWKPQWKVKMLRAPVQATMDASSVLVVHTLTWTTSKKKKMKRFYEECELLQPVDSPAWFEFRKSRYVADERETLGFSKLENALDEKLGSAQRRCLEGGGWSTSQVEGLKGVHGANELALKAQTWPMCSAAAPGATPNQKHQPAFHGLQREVEVLSPPTIIGLATCHGLAERSGKVEGYALEKDMFRATGYTLEPETSENTVMAGQFAALVASPIGKLFGVVARFPFDAARQRSSVVVEDLDSGNRYVYAKGSPEAIHKVCTPNTLPSNYVARARSYAHQGFYVVALATKTFAAAAVSPKSEASQPVARDAVEGSLGFLGFMLFVNQVKPESPYVVGALEEAGVDVRIITGDDALTAIHVARKINMNMQASVLLIDAQRHDESAGEAGTVVVYTDVDELAQSTREGTSGSSTEDTWAPVDRHSFLSLAEGSTLAITGAAIEQLLASSSDDDAEEHAEAASTAPPTLSLADFAEELVGRTKMSDSQFLFDDLVVVFILSLLMVRTPAAPQLGSSAVAPFNRMPPRTLFAAEILLSLLGQLAIFLGCVYIALAAAEARPWFCSAEKALELTKHASDGGESDPDVVEVPCYVFVPGEPADLTSHSYENSVLWRFGHLQYWIAAVSLNVRDNYRAPVIRANRAFVAYAFGLLIILLVQLLGDNGNVDDEQATTSAAVAQALKSRGVDVSLGALELPAGFAWSLFSLFLFDAGCVLSWEILVVGLVLPRFQMQHHAGGFRHRKGTFGGWRSLFGGSRDSDKQSLVSPYVNERNGLLGDQGVKPGAGKQVTVGKQTLQPLSQRGNATAVGSDDDEEQDVLDIHPPEIV
ncbi:hypothetical protein PRIC2_009614 [Phytophthora ramorum]